MEKLRTFGNTVSKFMREVIDPFTVTDVEKIANFPHGEGCSKTLPLKILLQGPVPSWGNLGIGTKFIESCPECKVEQVI